MEPNNDIPKQLAEHIRGNYGGGGERTAIYERHCKRQLNGSKLASTRDKAPRRNRVKFDPLGISREEACALRRILQYLSLIHFLNIKLVYGQCASQSCS